MANKTDAIKTPKKKNIDLSTIKPGTSTKREYPKNPSKRANITIIITFIFLIFSY